MCIRFLACLYNIDIMARLILLLCVLHSWRHSTCEQGQLLSSNSYLFAIGNDENGYERLLAASQPTNMLSLSLDGYSVSSACGSHPSRCRELLIESTDTSSLTSTHILLVPLEDGVQILELAYNGTAINQISLVTQHTLLFDSVNGNHSCGPSLGVHKIGPDYFIPCIGTDHRYYVCELILNSTAVTQSTLQPCRQVNVNVSIVENGAGFSIISNIVATNESLVFLVQNTLYELFPSSSSNYPFTFAFPTYCSSVDQLLLISPQDEQNLLAYCRNRNVITYNLNLHSITRIEEASNIPYPCSPTAQYTVHLSQMQMEFSYKISKDGNPVIRIFESPTTSMNFHSGTCFESVRGDHLLVYTDRSIGAYLFNMTSESLWLIPATQGCSESDCELPLIYGNRYIVVRNELRRNVMVFDVLLNRSIIDLGSAPLQLVTLMSDLPTIPIHSVPPTTMYVDPRDSSDEPNQTHVGTKRGVSLEVIVPVAILSILVVIIVIAIIIILFVIVIKRCCSGSRTSGKYKLPDVTFAKQPQDVVIENYSVPESQPMNTVAAELGAEADNDSSYSNPVYSGSFIFDDHEHGTGCEETPATVIVFENQVTSDSLSVDHNVDTPYYPQDPEEQTATDLSISETQKLIEPDKAGSKDNTNINTAASLEDEINPPSDNQGEVIINAHASSSGPECFKGNSQPESSPAPSTDQLITESEEPPSQLNSQFSAVRVEEQTVINGTSDPSELISPMVDKEFENGGHVSDGTIDREGEGGGRRAESTEHKVIETSGSLNSPLYDNGEKQGTSIASELSLSADQKSEDRGCVSDDTKDRESELERSANSTEYGETEEPPLPSNAICTQLNSNGEGEFEEGDRVSDDKTGSEGDKSDKSALPDEATSELPVILKGREEQASGELLSLPDQDNADNNNDIEGEEKVNGTGDKEGEGNSGEISLQVINHSSGLPSEINSSALESGNPTEVTHSHDIDQHQQHTPSDSANPFDHEKQEVGEEDTLPSNSDPDVIHPMDMLASPILPAVVVPETEATEDHTEDLSSVHCDAAEESSEPPEEISEVEEDFSQTSKHDFEGIPKEFEHAMVQELGDNPETREIKGDKGDHGDSKASAKELKHVVDQEDVRENEELNEGKEDDSKHQYEIPVPAKELEHNNIIILDQDVVGDYLETSDISGNKGDDEFGSEAPAIKLEHQIETKEVNNDERYNNLEASANVYGLEDHEEIAIGDHLETKKLNGDKSEDSSDDGNAFNHQSPESFSDIDHDDIDTENHTNPLDLGDKITDLIQLDSVAKLEESKNTNGQSEDEVLPSTECLESDLNLTSLSLRHKEECNGNTELDKPADPDKSLFSQDDSREEKGVIQDSSTEADQVKIFSEDRMSADAEAQTYDGISIESQERYYEEIAPIKCTFVGRTIKTVIRTSTEANNQYDNCTGNLPKTQHTDTAVSTNRSKESLTLPNGDLAKKAESGHLRNGAFPISNGDPNQHLQKNTQASIGDDVLPKQEQKFPYKYETII